MSSGVAWMGSSSVRGACTKELPFLSWAGMWLKPSNSSSPLFVDSARQACLSVVLRTLNTAFALQRQAFTCDSSRQFRCWSIVHCRPLRPLQSVSPFRAILFCLHCPGRLS